MNSIWELLFNLFLIETLIPSIGEELFFRGIIQKKLGNILKSPHVAVILTFFIFSNTYAVFGFLPRFGC